MNEEYKDEEILAITQVCYIVNHLAPYEQQKIPKEIMHFLEDNADWMIYQNLRITDEDLSSLSDSAKHLLNVINLYLSKKLS